MFKFIHAADLHLDSPLRGLARYETAPAAAIRSASRRAFENLIELALTEEVAFVLFAGDLFDGDWKDHQTGIYFNQQIGLLASREIRVIVVAGNHDASSRITKVLKPPPNVSYLSVHKPQSLRLADLGVVVHGQGFKEPHTSDNLAAAFPAAEPGLLNIGLVHTSLDGREGHASYAPCSLDDLRQKGYQYWALGHVHEREVVCEDPLVVFSGCIQGRHARETGPKGCTLVAVEDGMIVEHEHHVLDVVRWSQLTVDATDSTNEEELIGAVRQAVKAEIAAVWDRLLALRVRVEGATPIDAKLRAAPEKWRSQVQAIGAELGEEQVWIEKVQIATLGKRSLAEVLERDEVLAGLLSVVIEHDTTSGSVPGLDKVIVELKSKLPPAFFAGEESFDPASAQVVTEVIDEAKALLVARLLESEATP